MKTKVTTNKQAVKITKRLEAQLKEAIEIFNDDDFIIETSNSDTFLTTTIHSNNNWIMSRIVVERITKIADRFCKRYEQMIWGFECGEYTSTSTGNKYPTPQLYIQLSIIQ
jgi:hypothetical protein